MGKDQAIPSGIKSRGEQPAEISAIEAKLQRIELPEVNLSDATLQDTLAYLQQASVNFDPEKTGVNILLKNSNGDKSLPITMRLRNTPLDVALQLTSQLSGIDYTVTKHGVVFGTEPKSELFTNQYTVPPTFLHPEGIHIEGPPKPSLTAKEILSNAGIKFGDGATADYTPATSTLLVRNTKDQLKLIEDYIETIRNQVETVILARVSAVTSDKPILSQIHRQPPEGRYKMSRGFKQWENMKDFIYGESINEEVRQGKLAHEQFVKLGAVPMANSGVFSDAKIQKWYRLITQEPKVKVENLGSHILRSGKSGAFANEKAAIGVGAVLGADNYTIHVELYPRNLRIPGSFYKNKKSLGSQTIWDGDSVAVTGKLNTQEYFAFIVTFEIIDPAGQRKNSATQLEAAKAAKLKDQ